MFPRVFNIITCCLLFTGCGATNDVKIADLQTGDRLFTSTPQSHLLIQRTRDGKNLHCTLHAAEGGTSSDVNFSIIGGGSTDSGGDDTEFVEMIGRTPVLIMQRDALNALCNMHMSGLISDEKYVSLVNAYLLKYSELMKAQISSTTISINDTLSETTAALPEPEPAK